MNWKNLLSRIRINRPSVIRVKALPQEVEKAINLYIESERGYIDHFDPNPKITSPFFKPDPKRTLGGSIAGRVVCLAEASQNGPSGGEFDGLMEAEGEHTVLRGKYRLNGIVALSWYGGLTVFSLVSVNWPILLFIDLILAFMIWNQAKMIVESTEISVENHLRLALAAYEMSFETE